MSGSGETTGRRAIPGKRATVWPPARAGFDREADRVTWTKLWAGKKRLLVVVDGRQRDGTDKPIAVEGFDREFRMTGATD